MSEKFRRNESLKEILFSNHRLSLFGRDLLRFKFPFIPFVINFKQELIAFVVDGKNLCTFLIGTLVNHNMNIMNKNFVYEKYNKLKILIHLNQTEII